MALVATRRRVVRRFISLGATSPGKAIDYHPSNPLSTWGLKRLGAAGVVHVTDDGRQWLEPSSYAAYRQRRRKRVFTLLAVVPAFDALFWLADGSGLPVALARSLAKLAIPTGAIVLVLMAVRLRRLSLHDDLALRAPSAASLAGWVGAHVGFMLLTNAAMDWRGPWDFTIWR